MKTVKQAVREFCQMHTGRTAEEMEALLLPFVFSVAFAAQFETIQKLSNVANEQLELAEYRQQLKHNEYLETIKSISTQK